MFKVHWMFKVYGFVYLVGSTVAIGFFRHCGSRRIHDTAALQEVRIQFLVTPWTPKVGLLESTIWGPKKAKVVPSQAMCNVQPMFNTQWV